MTRIWNSRQDVKHAAEIVEAIWKEGGSIPPELVEAYREILATASKGMVVYFYECLATEAPGAVRLFLQEDR